MPIYTVHEPPAKRKPHRRGPESFLFVRDGFYFWAFLLPPLWMLWRRLWLVLLGWFVVSVAMGAAMHFAEVSASVRFLAQGLLSLLIGLEAGSLWRWTLRRRNWRELATVSAENLEAAERRFFDLWIGDDGPVRSGVITPSPYGRPSAAPFTAAPIRPSGSPDVVGLFPEPGAGR
jgi:hypothetical protein